MYMYAQVYVFDRNAYGEKLKNARQMEQYYNNWNLTLCKVAVVVKLKA